MKNNLIPFAFILLFLMASCESYTSSKKTNSSSSNSGSTIQSILFDENSQAIIKQHNGQTWVDQSLSGDQTTSHFSLSGADAKARAGKIFPARDGLVFYHDGKLDFYDLSSLPNLETPISTLETQPHGKFLASADRYATFYENGELKFYTYLNGKLTPGTFAQPFLIDDPKSFFLFSYGFGILNGNKFEVYVIGQAIDTKGKRTLAANRMQSADFPIGENETVIPFPLGFGILKNNKMEYFRFNPNIKGFERNPSYDYQLADGESAVLAGYNYKNIIVVKNR